MSETAQPSAPAIASDEHHDWVIAALHVDPRAYGTASAADLAGGSGNTLAETGAGTSSTFGALLSDAYAQTVKPLVEDVVATGEKVLDRAASMLDSVEDIFGLGPEAKARETASRILDPRSPDTSDLPLAEKVQLAKDLLAHDPPSQEALAARNKLYRDMSPDPDFEQRDLDRDQQIADDLQNDQSLRSARENWATSNEQEKIAAMKKVLDAQSKRLGIPAPDIVVDHIKVEDTPLHGFFNRNDGKLHLNMDPSSNITDFQQALSSVIHENAHNYQEHLINEMNAGRLKPGDPDYLQATMFEVNNRPNGYVDALDDPVAYQRQPSERHAFSTGAHTASRIVEGLAHSRK